MSDKIVSSNERVKCYDAVHDRWKRSKTCAMHKYSIRCLYPCCSMKPHSDRYKDLLQTHLTRKHTRSYPPHETHNQTDNIEIDSAQHEKLARLIVNIQ